MYRALWDIIKLPIIIKVVLFLLLFMAIVAGLFLYGFPYLAQFLPYPIGNAGVDL
jgi:hypothetical protein